MDAAFPIAAKDGSEYPAGEFPFPEAAALSNRSNITLVSTTGPYLHGPGKMEEIRDCD
jgi:hypothetical protein